MSNQLVPYKGGSQERPKVIFIRNPRPVGRRVSEQELKAVERVEELPQSSTQARPVLHDSYTPELWDAPGALKRVEVTKTSGITLGGLFFGGVIFISVCLGCGIIANILEATH